MDLDYKVIFYSNIFSWTCYNLLMNIEMGF